MDFLSSNLKYLREKYKMSQNALAKRMNVNHSTISRWESGEMGATVANAFDLSEIFNVTVAELVGVDLRNDKTAHRNIIILSKNIGKYKKGDAIELNELLEYIESLYTKNKSYEDMFKELSDRFGINRKEN